MGVGAVEAVGGFEEGNDAFHACQPFFPGYIAPVDARKYRHDAETAAAGGYYILVVFGVHAVHVDTLPRQPAVGLGSVPEVIEGAALYGIQQGIVAQCPGCAAGFPRAAGSCQERQEEKRDIYVY